MNSEDERLGRLEKVSLREIWLTEAGKFTPWLAQENNIALLGDTVGIELEVEAQEKGVGPFRADILCKDTANGHWVLIENQLERTDHGHLGQLMTYAAGLSAVTIVWIADQFTDEHRAALDWLNDITSEEYNFFGLEVELWKIGNSAVAPKFNVISKPNDWTRSISGAASRLATEKLTETKKLQLEFWMTFRQLLEERSGVVRPTKPMAQHWVTFSIGRSDFWIYAFANTRNKRIGVTLVLGGPHAKPHFHLLHKDEAVLEEAFGEPLNWREMPDKKESHISLTKPETDPTIREQWPEQQAWLFEKLQRLHRTFSQPIKQLDADDYEIEDGDD